MASDGYFGLILCANRFELCAKVQAVFYEGFPGDDWPDDWAENSTLMVGGHAMYLFRPWDRIDLAVGADFRYGITLATDVEDNPWERCIDAGARIAINYHLGERFMLSGVLYPFWLVNRETTEDDSYHQIITTPVAVVAVSFFF